MELKFTKKSKSVSNTGYNVVVETIASDGDSYPKYTMFFSELSNDFILLSAYFLDASILSEEEYDKAYSLFLEVQDDCHHKLHELFFHWDDCVDAYEEIHHISIVYTDEDGIDYDVTIE